MALAIGVTSAAQAARFGEGRIWLEALSPSEQDGVPLLADANGDGKADLIVYNQQQGIARVGLSSGSGFAQLRTWAIGLPRGGATILPYFAADVGGDGRADLIIFAHGDGQTAGSANTFVALSTGSGFQFPAQPVWNAGFCVTVQTCLVADVNGDGKADIVAITQDFGTVFVSLSTGASFGPNAVWHNFFCIRGEHCALGDVDGDRRADAILFKPVAPGVQKGNVLVAASTGAGFGAARLGHGFFCIDGETCLVGNLDGDGRADVLLVKGMSAEPGLPAEVLVSLSNGTTFINPVPFAWAQPRRPAGASFWGQSLLGDVTGDGRADLVKKFTITVRQTGGSERTIKSAYLVQPVVDGFGPQPAPPPAGEDASAGFAEVDILNCDPDQHRFTYVVRDSGGGEARHGPIDAMYAESGFCPDPADEAFNVALEAGRIHEIIAIDPEAIGCEGRDDPDIVACAKHRFALLGAANGKTARVILSAGPALQHLMAQHLPMPELRLAELDAAGLDFSVTREEIIDFLGNDFSKYIQFSQGLLAVMEGRKLQKPLFIDVVFFNYEEIGGAVALDSPDGALDADKARAALVSGFNSRYGARETTVNAILGP